ncbi:MAG: RES family NAD+ phosphorylase [Chloroflexota bacterium]
MTQAIARWAFDRGFEGIIYSSRLDSTLTCVAIFEGVATEPLGLAEPIRIDDPNFRAAAETFGLAL